MELGIGEVNGAMALGTALGLETGFTRSDRSLDLNDKNELLEHQELQCQASGRYDFLVEHMELPIGIFGACSFVFGTLVFFFVCF